MTFAVTTFESNVARTDQPADGDRRRFFPNNSGGHGGKKNAKTTPKTDTNGKTIKLGVDDFWTK